MEPRANSDQNLEDRVLSGREGNVMNEANLNNTNLGPNEQLAIGMQPLENQERHR